jgi:outer membrane protein, heavy metal efflux system
MRRIIILGVTIIISFYGIQLKAVSPDTISLTLEKTEAVFLDRNLQLLAQKCNVDAAKALVLQAKLWDNPTITVNQDVYNTETSTLGGKKWFDISKTGEANFQFQQIIYLAGKRNKRIKLADLTAQKTEYQFYDLLRTLKYQLRSDFYTLYYTQQSLAVYKKEIESLDKLVKVFEEQYQKGYVSKRDLLRLKASLFSLNSEKLGLESQLTDTREDFSLLLRFTNVYPLVVLDANLADSVHAEKLNLKALIDTASNYRNDLKAAQADLKYNEMNVAYQKALAIPDFQFIAGWDRNGSYFKNYNYIGIQMDLPFFNRNQGNIKSAQYIYQSSQYNLQSVQDMLENDLLSALTKAIGNDKVYRQFDKSFNADFTSMQDEVLKNYEKRNMSLLEFLDFYEAYKDNTLQYNALQNNRLNAFENLNFCVGKSVIKF